MTRKSNSVTGQGSESTVRPKWQTPTLIEDTILNSTQHYFGRGIDNYEGSNPVGYGS